MGFQREVVERLRGVIIALPTPMRADGQVDARGVGDLVGWLVDRGVDGIFACGTTGEGPLLDLEERVTVLRAAVTASAGRVPVVAQVGGMTTAGTIAAARSAVGAGVDALAVMAPFYFRHSEAAVIAHFAAVADAVPDHPVLLYNIPQHTGNAITPSVVRALLGRPNLVGMKDSTGDPYGVLLISEAAGPAFRILVGADLLIPAMVAMGWAGTISGPAAAVPEPYVALWRAAARGSWPEVREAYQQVAAVCRMLHNGASVPHIKAALALRGVIAPHVRAPLQPVAEGETQALRSALERATGRLGALRAL
ncbi:MAG: dihydrodipicolinate synthase family protein [Armatimonadota bacterium]|nr:dihydrodipicolinate synthase family protein [Armatimonadota bacterium]MDR7519283.1 dihydrodipicolinate synthase family protein [Armatimonadota bacterium]MDR7551204.1 dihydrodipicolinate synthase family protein [Armatimonadota bacterium]